MLMRSYKAQILVYQYYYPNSFFMNRLFASGFSVVKELTGFENEFQGLCYEDALLQSCEENRSEKYRVY